jgi:hypothetical protein
VKIIDSGNDQSQETCLNALAAFERSRQGVQAAQGNSFLKEDPVASLSLPRRQ